MGDTITVIYKCNIYYYFISLLYFNISKANIRTNLSVTSLELKDIAHKIVLKPHVCKLRIIIDHTLVFFTKHRELNRVIDRINEIVSATSSIFSQIDFNQDGLERDLTLYIEDFRIYLDINDTPFSDEKLAANEFLEKFIHISSYDVCLAIAFTFRLFPENILGLGYKLSESSGACHKTCNKIVINLQDSNQVPLTFNQSVFTLLHEISHAFGAETVINKNNKCKVITTSDENKFWISHNLIPDNEYLNEINISNCYIKDIENSLKYDYIRCLSYEYPVCGNAIKDNDEECDCGRKEYCSLIDPCCNPPEELNSYGSCQIKRRLRFQCSSRDLCCTENCRFVPAYARKLCSINNECYTNNSCTGKDSQCPQVNMKNDSSPCKQGLGECINGECNLIACKKYNMTNCNCQKPKDVCKVCCSWMDLCLPIIYWGVNSENDSILLPVGEPCLSDGLCTSSGECETKAKAVKKKEKKAEVKEKWSLLTHIVMGLTFFIALIILTSLSLLIWKLINC